MANVTVRLLSANSSTNRLFNTRINDKYKKLFTKLGNKAKSLGYSVRTEFTSNGLSTELTNHYTTRMNW